MKNMTIKGTDGLEIYVAICENITEFKKEMIDRSAGNLGKLARGDVMKRAEIEDFGRYLFDVFEIDETSRPVAIVTWLSCLLSCLGAYTRQNPIYSELDKVSCLSFLREDRLGLRRRCAIVTLQESGFKFEVYDREIVLEWTRGGDKDLFDVLMQFLDETARIAGVSEDDRSRPI